MGTNSEGMQLHRMRMPARSTRFLPQFAHIWLSCRVCVVMVVGDFSDRLKWNEARNLALCAQVITAGPAAFFTHRANSKRGGNDGKGVVYNQTLIWVAEPDGIVPQLKKHEAFEGVQWPDGHQSIINHLEKLLNRRKRVFLQVSCRAAGATASQRRNGPANCPLLVHTGGGRGGLRAPAGAGRRGPEGSVADEGGGCRDRREQPRAAMLRQGQGGLGHAGRGGAAGVRPPFPRGAAGALAAPPRLLPCAVPFLCCTVPVVPMLVPR